MKTAIVTAPSSPPVTVAEFKTHQRVTDDTEDSYVGDLLDSATLHLEELCNRKFITQTWKLYLDAWPGDAELELPFGKTASVTSIVYKDEDGTEATFSSDDYTVDTELVPGRIVIGYDKAWPSASLFNVNPIAITFVCGYGAAADVPKDIKQAVQLLTAHWFENREPVHIGIGKVTNLPYAIDALIWNHRLF